MPLPLEGRTLKARWLAERCRVGRRRPGWLRMRHARQPAAQVDLPALRPHLVGRRAGGRRHERCVDRIRLGRGETARQAARPVAAARTRRRATAAVPARRALGRALVRAPHAAHARARLRGARHRLPRLRPEHARPALGRPGARRRAGRLAMARATATAGAALRLRPLARRRDRGAAGQRGRRRHRRHRRRQLHLDRRRLLDDEMGLAAVGAADHAALRRRVAAGEDQGAIARRARQRTTT